MLSHILKIFWIITALSSLGASAASPPQEFDDSNEVEVADLEEFAPNVAEFELTFGADCTIPPLKELEMMLRHHFELGVTLYDADIDEEIDVIVNIHETWKISRVVSYLQQEEGLECDMSVSDALFVSAEILPDSNEFLESLYESHFMEDADHMEMDEEERRNLGNYPEVLDLRPLSTGVKSQGRVGSCAAFAASTVKEIHERKDYDLKEALSPRFVYAHRTDGEGMYTHRVFTVLRDEGIPLEKHFPILGYKTSGKYDKPSDIPAEAKRNAKMHRVSSVTNVSPSSYSVDSLRNRLKELLNKKGAGTVAISVFAKAPGNDQCKIYKKEGNEKYRDGHLMAVVGYNKEGLIIRNSWGSWWCTSGDLYMPWSDAQKYVSEFTFWQDTSSRSCRNFEDVTGTTCWSLGHRALNPNALCQGSGCSLVDASRCCVQKKKTCLSKNSCCAWGTTCYGCPDNGNSKFEWAWNCGTSRRCNGRSSSNVCRKSPGECCTYGGDCHGCPWGNEHVWPSTCGSSRRCKYF